MQVILHLNTYYYLMKPDCQGDHTKNEAGHDEILGASHGTAIAEIRNQHLTWKCDKKVKVIEGIDLCEPPSRGTIGGGKMLQTLHQRIGSNVFPDASHPDNARVGDLKVKNIFTCHG